MPCPGHIVLAGCNAESLFIVGIDEITEYKSDTVLARGIVEKRRAVLTWVPCLSALYQQFTNDIRGMLPPLEGYDSTGHYKNNADLSPLLTD